MKERKVKVRKYWGELNPSTRVRGSRKVYNRAKEKEKTRKEEFGQ